MELIKETLCTKNQELFILVLMHLLWTAFLAIHRARIMTNQRTMMRMTKNMMIVKRLSMETIQTIGKAGLSHMRTPVN